MMIKILKSIFVLPLFLIVSCASTEIIESPRTIALPESSPKEPVQVIWSSRGLEKSFEYLGLIKARSWTYDGAVDRLIEAATELKADAVVDVHREDVGFLTQMDAFAVKFK